MSHKISMRNVQRQGFIVELLTLIENPDVETTELQAALELRIEGYTRKIVSACPLCNRIYGFGDAVCNCAPQVVTKPGPDGTPVKVTRVVGLTNRHMLRSRVSQENPRFRKDMAATKWNNIFLERKCYGQLSEPETRNLGGEYAKAG